MNSIIIGVGSAANVLSALENIGFTVSTTNGTAYWGNDTNGKVHISVTTSSSNTVIKLVNSSGTAYNYNRSFASSSNLKLTYEVIGNSVVFGFILATSSNTPLEVMIIEPVGLDDDWIYVTRAVSTGAGGAAQIIDGRTEIVINYYSYQTGRPFNYNSDKVQIIKFYDGNRFMDNLYFVTCGPYLATTTLDYTNYTTATIGNKQYLLVGICYGATHGWAVAIIRQTLS